MQRVVEKVRANLGGRLFERVAGPEGPRRRERIHSTPGPRWFAEDAAIRRVHGDASMFVGGIRALLLQSLHPVAMAGVAEHSGFKGDPWGRLQRTSHFLAVTTFGPTADAERMVATIRSVHENVNGVAPDGRAYSATDPHLLRWVHVAEIDSFLCAHQALGHRPLDQAGRDAYVTETARVAEALGVVDPPRDEQGLRDRIEAYRPELCSTPAAREAARFILLSPPLPLFARVPYAALSAAAVDLMPDWARRSLRLPSTPLTDGWFTRTAGQAATRTIRWAMAPPA